MSSEGMSAAVQLLLKEARQTSGYLHPTLDTNTRLTSHDGAIGF